MDAFVLLRLLQVFDSQFPIGSFAHSGGLETYAQAGLDRAELAELLANQLQIGSGRADLAAAALAWTAVNKASASGCGLALQSIAQRVHAMKVVPGTREMSLGLGRRAMTLVRQLYPTTVADLTLTYPHYAVVIGSVGQRLGLPLRELLLAVAQGSVASSLAAATRAMPLSPVDAQRILVELQPAITRVVGQVLEDPESAFFSCAPGHDIRSHEQRFLYTRLFQS